MKKNLILLLCTFLILSSLSGCNAAGTNRSQKDSAQLHIIATIFPEYDWVMNILGDNPAEAEVTLLLSSGVDLHSYQPTAGDIMKISDCDVFIYVGGESDDWVDNALAEAVNPDMIVLNLLEVLGDAVKEEEVVEGMQEDEHEHEHEEGEDDHDHEEPEWDEHVWLSLRNAETLVKAISSALQEADPDNAETYQANTDAYVEKLAALDQQYTEAVASAAKDTLLFGDRFPFRYLTDDYGLSYYAAFVGCSAETEASFDTITFLAKKVDELGLTAILTIDSADQRIAETIISSTQTKDQQILSMNSMQSTTMKDVSNGVTYLSLMESNLEVLKEALQ